MILQWHGVVLLFLLLSVFDQTYSFLFKSYQRLVWPTKSKLFATTTTIKGGSGSGSKTKLNKKIKKKKKGKRKQRAGTPRSNEPSFNKGGGQTGKSPDTEGVDRNDSPPPRRFLVDYDSNRNPTINKFRLLDGRVQCPHYPNCPSCVITERIGDIPIIESAKQYFSSTDVRRRRRDVLERDVECDVVDSSDDGFFEVVLPSELEGWRSQAKLVVEPSTTSQSGRDEYGCDFGLYQKGSHSVVPIPNCAAHHPSINKAVAALKDATRNVRTVAYQEKLRVGDLRYAQFRVERSTGKICLTLVWNSENLKGTQPHLSRLVRELTKENNDEDLWHSIWCHCNDSKSNAIFSLNPDRWYRLFGPEYMREPISSGKRDENGGWLYFTPQTFRQGNMEGFDVLAKDVARAIPGGSKVCELYAGVGVLGLTALQYHHDSGTGDDNTSLKWIRCSDENPTNLKCFARAVKSLDPDITLECSAGSSSNVGSREMTEVEFTRLLHSGETKTAQMQSSKPQDKTSYVVASAAKALKSGEALGADVLVVDPPRKGLDLEVLDELCKPVNPNQRYVELSDLLPLEGSTFLWANDIKLLIYVSCGFKALARDSERLLSSGNWILESATGYILFPGSDHVETLCIFTRS